MSEKARVPEWVVLLTAGACFAGGLIAGHLGGRREGKEIGYRQGQIDAVTGCVRYELVVHPDSTRTWEEKSE